MSNTALLQRGARTLPQRAMRVLSALLLGLGACAPIDDVDASGEPSEERAPDKERSIGRRTSAIHYGGNCTDEQKAMLVDYEQQLTDLLLETSDTLIWSYDGPRANYWFNAQTREQQTMITSVLWAMSYYYASNEYTYTCGDYVTGFCADHPKAVAYTGFEQTEIGLCPSFWDENRDRILVLAHEVSHNVGTRDVELPRPMSFHQLAQEYPDLAMLSAVNYSYYIMNKEGLPDW